MQYELYIIGSAPNALLPPWTFIASIKGAVRVVSSGTLVRYWTACWCSARLILRVFSQLSVIIVSGADIKTIIFRIKFIANGTIIDKALFVFLDASRFPDLLYPCNLYWFSLLFPFPSVFCSFLHFLILNFFPVLFVFIFPPSYLCFIFYPSRSNTMATIMQYPNTVVCHWSGSLLVCHVTHAHTHTCTYTHTQLEPTKHVWTVQNVLRASFRENLDILHNHSWLKPKQPLGISDVTPRPTIHDYEKFPTRTHTVLRLCQDDLKEFRDTTRKTRHCWGMLGYPQIFLRLSQDFLRSLTTSIP